VQPLESPGQQRQLILSKHVELLVAKTSKKTESTSQWMC
jgi:hypothetical protein